MTIPFVTPLTCEKCGLSSCETYDGATLEYIMAQSADKPEYLRATCKRCGYTWRQAVAKAQP